MITTDEKRSSHDTRLLLNVYVNSMILWMLRYWTVSSELSSSSLLQPKKIHRSNGNLFGESSRINASPHVASDWNGAVTGIQMRSFSMNNLCPNDTSSQTEADFDAASSAGIRSSNSINFNRDPGSRTSPKVRWFSNRCVDHRCWTQELERKPLEFLTLINDTSKSKCQLERSYLASDNPFYMRERSHLVIGSSLLISKSLSLRSRKKLSA